MILKIKFIQKVMKPKLRRVKCNEKVKVEEALIKLPELPTQGSNSCWLTATTFQLLE